MKQIILISGGSEGLGREIARILTSSHSVVILAPSREKLKEVAKELRCDFVVGDVSDSGAVEKAVAHTVKKYGRIDCLINNAGIYIEGPLETNTPEDIERIIAVNTLGTMLMTRAVVPIMKKQRSGLIVNIVSQAGLRGKALRSVYGASKYAITGFTASLQPELAPYGIRVTGIYPAKMKTSLFRSAGVEKKFDDAFDPMYLAKTIAFLLTLPETVVITDIGMKHIKYL